MRYLFIALAILCGAASAEAAERTKWCSDPAWQGTDTGEIALSKTEATFNGNPIQRGFVRFAIIYGKDRKDRVVVYKGVVFWPCQSQK